jgi:hypothetical protein
LGAGFFKTFPPSPDRAIEVSSAGAAGAVLANRFGERKHFSMESDQMPGVVRSFKSFSLALEEVKNVRIFAGIHFR